MEKRQSRLEIDWSVSAGQPQIGEQGTEPAVGFDDSFIELIAQTAGEIGHRSDQQAPTGCSARDETAPHLNNSGLHEGGEKWRRKAPEILRRSIIEVRGKSGKLGSVAQRKPAVRPLIGPDHFGAIELHRESDRRKDIPAEGGGSRDWVAVAKGASRQGAAGGAIGALRRRSGWDQPEK